MYKVRNSYNENAFNQGQWKETYFNPELGRAVIACLAGAGRDSLEDLSTVMFEQYGTTLRETRLVIQTEIKPTYPLLL